MERLHGGFTPSILTRIVMDVNCHTKRSLLTQVKRQICEPGLMVRIAIRFEACPESSTTAGFAAYLSIQETRYSGSLIRRRDWRLQVFRSLICSGTHTQRCTSTTVYSPSRTRASSTPRMSNASHPSPHIPLCMALNNLYIHSDGLLLYDAGRATIGLLFTGAISLRHRIKPHVI